MNLIAALLVSLWVSGWALASVREILKARHVAVNHRITLGED
jgi:hypothetical protein